MRRLTLSLLAATVAAFLTAPAPAAASDVVAPVRDRFTTGDAPEVPDFQQHVVPLLGKLGCNGRACHGSFQGAGGFQLSLFGYDFQMDHKNLLDRIDTDDPADSYALHKPLLKEPHEGGQRLKLDTWEYNLFLSWIKGGARGIDEPQKLVKLEVTPRELIFSGPKQTRQLKAVAVWEDGTREDVTCISRFTSNDDAIAEVTDQGLVTSGDVGDSHVVVFYDNAVVPIPVIRPVSDQVGDKYPAVAASTPIDQHVVNKLRKLGIIPSATCTDSDFIRRVTLDITGTLPTAAEVREFLSDSSPDKRARKVDALLETPAYTAWWTTQICDWTGANDQQLVNVNPANTQRGSQDWYDWVYKRVADNTPYDELVENIVIATSRKPGESYRDYCDRMSDYVRDKKLSFADNDGLIYYWGRTNFRTNEDRAVGFAYTFMGTRIQCAQCHKHPFDVWTQDDFKQFEQFFARINFARSGADRNEYQKMIKELGLEGLQGNQQRNGLANALNREGKTIPFPELVINRGNQNARGPGNRQRSNARTTAKLLGEQEVDLNTIEDPRTALMDWLRNSPTKLFAKAFVNRVWANYFNRGIVEPTDDLSLANPPCNEDLLNYLADGFIASGYDMKWVHREICLSDTYQRTWQPNETNLHDERNFSRSVPRRLPAEVAYDALVMATANDRRAGNFATDLSGRATTSTSPPRNNNSAGANYALAVFGRSTRESACDCDRSSEASLLQTLFVRNDNETLSMLTRRDGWIAQLSGASATGERERTRAASGRPAEETDRRVARLMEELRAARRDGDRRRAAQIQARLAELRSGDSEEAATTTAQKVGIETARVVDEAYLRTVSRLPSEDERRAAVAYIDQAADTMTGVRDVLWALINTKEFMVNH